MSGFQPFWHSMDAAIATEVSSRFLAVDQTLLELTGIYATAFTNGQNNQYADIVMVVGHEWTNRSAGRLQTTEHGFALVKKAGMCAKVCLRIATCFSFLNVL